LEDAHVLAVLAETLGKEGLFEEGLLLLEELLSTIEKTDQRFWEAELHRLKGDLLVRQGGFADDAASVDEAASMDEAASSFLRAINVANHQEAKSFELRAALDLERLRQKQGRENDNQSHLAEIFEWFDEGFETPDLREAKALLASQG
jgi:predicted ATPase